MDPHSGTPRRTSRRRAAGVGATGAAAIVSVLSFAAIVAPGRARAAEPIDYSRDVRPILVEHCFHCHGADDKDRRGALRLDVRDAALRGGESDGAAITPGKPQASALIARVTSRDPDAVMPPPAQKKPLAPAQVAVLTRWIEEGAPYANHWAFDTPRKAPTPAGPHPIDALVERRLASLAVAPPAVPQADPATLCRRIHLDLIGLPPSPQDVAAFQQALASRGQAAVGELVDRLLQSPRYGEKWARHWLDAARYSDSNGYEKDLPREQWAWRDWVIGALQRDMPYDQFLIEQLAGDLLPGATQDQIVATGMLRNSMVNEEGAIVPEQFRMDEMFDRMDCIGKATIGLSLQCAQCHSHKFDPISQTEYYGMFAFLNNTYEAQSWVYTAEQRKQFDEIRKQVLAAEDRLRKQRPKWRDELAAWEKEVAAREPAWTPLRAIELESASGLNHPTQEADLTILTQGHPTTKGDIYGVFTTDVQGATGLRLEALPHRDLPFSGPGRSKYGTWAISELRVWRRSSPTDKWAPVRLIGATADFSEPDGPNEDEWKADFDKKQKRTRGPVAHLIDGDDLTGWRADRGPGLRNQPGVAVVRFEQPLDLPPGTELKIALQFDHGGSDNGRHTMQLGCCRLSLTTAPEPKAQPVDYAAILAIATPAERRTSAESAAIFAAWRRTLIDPESRKTSEAIAAEWAKHPVGRTSVLHLAEREPRHARPTRRLDRGAWDRPKDEVRPHFPAALHPAPQQPAAQSAAKSPDDGRREPNRLDFARWIASRESPLTARVAVNRTWQAMFGVGLVDTPEDFGTRSPAPPHQQLLDWLAVDFMEHGWSHKHLLRTIVSSGAYQRSSRATPAALEIDPTNRLLTRGPRFRMEAEMIRDAALSVAGLLHLQEVGGPSFFPPVPQSVLDYNYVKPTYWTPPAAPDRYRRAIYMFRKRSMPDPVLSSFDSPNGDFACARRPRSNTPLSALAGLNETTFVEAAQALAQRILKQGGADDAARVQYAWRLCMARDAKPAEIEPIVRLLSESRDRLRRGELKATTIAFSPFTRADDLPADATPNDIAAWTIVCRVLLNLDETLTKS